ncbi:MAG TPA: hypothetical protein VK832_13300 [Burkholderiaceae bacterium]|jgi:hypothetical protein|nr:hypothetical protein [Burkholderiaceae bacterium]
MKKSVKAALWSGLVFPGVGQAFLKHYLRGCVIFIAATVSAYIYSKIEINQALSLASDLSDKMESGAGSLDFISMLTMAEKLDAQLKALPPNPIAEIAFWMFVVCWGFSIVDAYLLGLKLEPKDVTSKSA